MVFIQRQNEQANTQYYRQMHVAKFYNEDRYGSKFGKQLQVLEAEAFTDLLPDTGSILDIGTGTGKLLIPIQKRERRIIGVDTSHEMLSILKDNCRSLGILPRISVCDAHNLSFKDNTFECVVSSRVLMHLADWQIALTEFCRVSKNTLIIDFPPTSNFVVIAPHIQYLLNFIRKPQPVYKPLSITRVAKHIKNLGFQSVFIKRQFFFPIFLHRFLDNPILSQKIEKLATTIGLTKLFGAPVMLMANKIPEHIHPN